MLQLQIVLIIFAILTIVSAIPIIDLKYHSDLYDYIDTFNEYCFQNDEDSKLSLPEKETYMWKICHYLYDFNIKFDIEALANNSNTNEKTPFIEKQSIYSMNVYNSFSYYGGISFGIILLIITLYLFVSIFNNYYLENYYHFSLWVFILIFIIIFIVLFSIILKKITEIYNDTYVYHYTIFIMNLNCLLSNINLIYKTEGSSKIKIDEKDITELQQYGNDVSNIVFNPDILKTFAKPYDYEIYIADKQKVVKSFKFEKQKTGVSNSETWQMYTYQNVDMYPIYHSKEQKDNIKYKINVVVSYLIAYFILLVALFLLFARTYDDYFLYVYIIIMLVIAITAYYIYSALR